jgi:hypothetical protein
LPELTEAILFLVLLQQLVAAEAATTSLIKQTVDLAVVLEKDRQPPQGPQDKAMPEELLMILEGRMVEVEGVVQALRVQMAHRQMAALVETVLIVQ